MKLWKIFERGKGLHLKGLYGVPYNKVRKVFKEYIYELNDNLEIYGLHSLRSVGTSSAFNTGVTD